MRTRRSVRNQNILYNALFPGEIERTSLHKVTPRPEQDGVVAVCGICRSFAEIHPAIDTFVCLGCAAQRIDGLWYAPGSDRGIHG